MRRAVNRSLVFLLPILLVIAPVQPVAQIDVEGFYTEPFIVSAMDMHTAAINQMDTDSKGQFLVTGSDDKSIRVWSRETHHMLRAIRVETGPGFVGRIFAVALSPNGDIIAAGGFTDARPTGAGIPEFHIYLFDRTTGRQVGLLGGLPGVVNQLAFSPRGDRLAAALGGIGANGVWLFDVQTSHKIASDVQYSDSCRGVAFDRDGRLATTSFDGKLRLYTPDLRRLQVVTAPAGPSPFGIAFHPDGRVIAVGYFGAPHVDILDAMTLNRIGEANTSGVAGGDLSRVGWSSDGRLFAAGSWQRNGELPVRAWTEMGRRVIGDFPVAKNTITALHPLADGTIAVASGDPRLALLGPNGAKEWVVDSETVDFREQDSSFAVSPDGTRVRFFLDRVRSVQAVFDLRKRELDIDPHTDPTLRTARVDGVAATWRNTFDPTLAGKTLPLDTRETSRSLGITPSGDSLVLGAEWSLNHFRQDGTRLWRVQAPGVAWAVNVPLEGQMVVAAYSDGTIRWHRLSDGGELLALYPHADGKRWVAWTPLGHYMASPGGETLIEWQINRDRDNAPDVFSVARFRYRFYRPDVVEQVLAELDPARALAAADGKSGRTTDTRSIVPDTPPRVAIVDPADNTFIDKNDIGVEYVVLDRPGSSIREIRLLLDGQLLTTQGNLVIPPSGLLSGTLHAHLEGTGRLLSLVAVSDKGVSDFAKVQIRHSATPERTKPSLYALAVGIARFESNQVTPLLYPEKDAIDFAKQMRAQEGGLYRKVQIRTLVSKEATNRAILDGLFWLEREMQQGDVASIFISTHGQNDASGKFYLLPYDVSTVDELDLRRTAVRYSDVRETLIRLAERGKTLVFLDACHSGNVVSGSKAGLIDVDEVAADLAASESGVVVFSSSTGRQLSLERPQLGHGVFTYALLEAFEGKAARDPPWLYVSDLNLWLRDEVKRLTNGAQTPQTTFPEQRLIDPRIFRVTSGAQ
jgi:WD40 repeat protein